jgi:hypothetical protein
MESVGYLANVEQGDLKLDWLLTNQLISGFDIILAIEPH